MRKIPELRKEFLRVYKMLPKGEKTKVCLVIPWDGTDEPCGWRVCELEIRCKTKLGRQMLRQLERLEII